MQPRSAERTPSSVASFIPPPFYFLELRARVRRISRQTKDTVANAVRAPRSRTLTPPINVHICVIFRQPSVLVFKIILGT